MARQAAALLDTLSPAGRAKADIIASLTPEVEKPGDAVKGKALFTGACSTCHKLGTLGKVEVGPPLNGMGAHGRAALLTHIIDPNREVDPSFWQWNVTTKKGETLDGVIAGENASGLTLRNTNGDVVVAKEDIATRENTRRSLMPEGLEALGPEALRDILTFIVANGSPTAAGDDQSSASSTCARPTPQTAAAACAAKTSATRPSRCIASAMSRSQASHSSSWIRRVR